MAIDYGQKRVGIAVTDPFKMIANGLPTIETPKAMAFIKDYTNKEVVEGFVIGVPKNLRNEEMNIVPQVNLFIGQLNKNFPAIPVHRVDERFTSKIASQTIAQSGLGKKKRQQKELVDKISAVIILQDFLQTYHP